MDNTRIFISSTEADRFPLGINRTDDIALDISEPIACKGEEQLFITLENFSCPISRYNIRDGFNSIVIDTTTYSLATGQYNTPDDFKTALQAAIGTVLTITYSALTNKISFQNTTATAVTIKKESTISLLLGLTPGTDMIIPANSSATTPKMLDLTGGLRNINIVLKNIDLNSADSINGSALGTNVLYSIPISVGWGQIQTYVAQGSEQMILSNRKNISSLEIALVDQLGNPYELDLKWTAMIHIKIA